MIKIAKLYRTQRKLRNSQQLAGMICAIEEDYDLPPILISESPEGLVIEDGHDRCLSYWLSGRSELEYGEFILVQKDFNHRPTFGRIWTIDVGQGSESWRRKLQCPENEKENDQNENA